MRSLLLGFFAALAAMTCNGSETLTQPSGGIQPTPAGPSPQTALVPTPVLVDVPLPPTTSVPPPGVTQRLPTRLQPAGVRIARSRAWGHRDVIDGFSRRVELERVLFLVLGV